MTLPGRTMTLLIPSLLLLLLLGTPAVVATEWSVNDVPTSVHTTLSRLGLTTGDVCYVVPNVEHQDTESSGWTALAYNRVDVARPIAGSCIWADTRAAWPPPETRHGTVTAPRVSCRRFLMVAATNSNGGNLTIVNHDPVERSGTPCHIPAVGWMRGAGGLAVIGSGVQPYAPTDLMFGPSLHSIADTAKWSIGEEQLWCLLSAGNDGYTWTVVHPTTGAYPSSLCGATTGITALLAPTKCWKRTDGTSSLSVWATTTPPVGPAVSYVACKTIATDLPTTIALDDATGIVQITSSSGNLPVLHAQAGWAPPVPLSRMWSALAANFATVDLMQAAFVCRRAYVSTSKTAWWTLLTASRARVGVKQWDIKPQTSAWWCWTSNADADPGGSWLFAPPAIVDVYAESATTEIVSTVNSNWARLGEQGEPSWSSHGTVAFVVSEIGFTSVLDTSGVTSNAAVVADIMKGADLSLQPPLGVLTAGANAAFPNTAYVCLGRRPDPRYQWWTVLQTPQRNPPPTRARPTTEGATWEYGPGVCKTLEAPSRWVAAMQCWRISASGVVMWEENDHQFEAYALACAEPYSGWAVNDAAVAGACASHTTCTAPAEGADVTSIAAMSQHALDWDDLVCRPNRLKAASCSRLWPRDAWYWPMTSCVWSPFVVRPADMSSRRVYSEMRLPSSSYACLRENLPRSVRMVPRGSTMLSQHDYDGRNMDLYDTTGEWYRWPVPAPPGYHLSDRLAARVNVGLWKWREPWVACTTPGTHCDFPGTADPLPCPPGRFCPGSGFSYECPDGTYSPTTGNAQCIPCAAGLDGEYCPAGTIVPTRCSDISGGCALTGVNATTLVQTHQGACPIGLLVAHVAAITNVHICTTCPRGFYCPDQHKGIACPCHRQASSVAECPEETGSTRVPASSAVVSGYPEYGVVASTCRACRDGAVCEEGVERVCPSGTIATGPNRYWKFTRAAPSNAVLHTGGDRLFAECAPCPKGGYCTSNATHASTTPTPCPAGTYRDETGGKTAHECSLCAKHGPATHWCDVGTQSIKDLQYLHACPIGTRANDARDACEPTPAGWLHTEKNGLFKCPQGAYCPNIGVTTTLGNVIPCPIGTVCGVAALPFYRLCPAGQWVTQAFRLKRAQCTHMPAELHPFICSGSESCGDTVSIHSALITANINIVTQDNVTLALSEIATALSIASALCPTAYQWVAPPPLTPVYNRVCTPTPPGVLATGRAIPSLCPAGTTSNKNIPGVVDGSLCVPCPLGYYCYVDTNATNVLTAHPPTACPPGTYNTDNSNSTTAAVCIPCKAGFICPGPAATAWTSVSPGNYSKRAWGVSQPCPVGHYCPMTATSVEDLGARLAIPCPAGTQALDSGHDLSCDACDIAHYCPGYAATARALEAADALEIEANDTRAWVDERQSFPCPAGYDLSTIPLLYETSLERAVPTGALDHKACPTQACPLNSACPEGVSTPLRCQDGTYGGGANCAICPRGAWCSGGVISGKCSPAVLWGPVNTTTEADACIACPEGYTCEHGSVVLCAMNTEDADTAPCGGSACAEGNECTAIQTPAACTALRVSSLQQCNALPGTWLWSLSKNTCTIGSEYANVLEAAGEVALCWAPTNGVIDVWGTGTESFVWNTTGCVAYDSEPNAIDATACVASGGTLIMADTRRDVPICSWPSTPCSAVLDGQRTYFSPLTTRFVDTVATTWEPSFTTWGCSPSCATPCVEGYIFHKGVCLRCPRCGARGICRLLNGKAVCECSDPSVMSGTVSCTTCAMGYARVGRTCVACPNRCAGRGSCSPTGQGGALECDCGGASGQHASTLVCPAYPGVLEWAEAVPAHPNVTWHHTECDGHCPLTAQCGLHRLWASSQVAQITGFEAVCRCPVNDVVHWGGASCTECPRGTTEIQHGVCTHCARRCSGHGVCNQATSEAYGGIFAKCQCDVGWAGEACDRCDAVHTGLSCDVRCAGCSPEHGHCTSWDNNPVCICDSGWAGIRCDIPYKLSTESSCGIGQPRRLPIASSGVFVCHTPGTLRRDATGCLCKPGWSGVKCTEASGAIGCTHDTCSARGVCTTLMTGDSVSTSCECHSPWSGSQCHIVSSNMTTVLSAWGVSCSGVHRIATVVDGWPSCVCDVGWGPNAVDANILRVAACGAYDAGFYV
jgi:hypothetical protein